MKSFLHVTLLFLVLSITAPIFVAPNWRAPEVELTVEE